MAEAKQAKDKLASKDGLVNADVIHGEAIACEADLMALKVAYEQYFLGLERRPPTHPYEAFKKRIMRLKNTFTKSTSAKFRVDSVYQKFLTYERLWQKTIQEMENGTYKRDLFKASLHRKKGPDASDQKKKSGATDDDFEISEDLGDMGIDEAMAEAEAAVTKPPPAPVAAATRSVTAVPPPKQGVTVGVPAVKPPTAPAPVAAKAPAPAPARPVAPVSTPSPQALSDAKVKAIYDAYVTAKRRCSEDTSKITLDSVAQTLRKQVPEIMKQHNAKGVDFKVVIKDGKALLRAVPKE